MLSKIKTSFKDINHKLFISLLVMGLVPTIYTTLRVFWLGNLPGDWAYSIAGQLSWINLIYEVINEAIILPLFYFIGKVISDKKDLTNRMKTGLLITLGIYILLSIIIMTCTNPLLKAMATDPSIIDSSATYIRIEAIANVFGILSQFALVGLVTLGKDKLVYILTGVKLLLCVVLDLFLVSTLAFSANLGVNGIGVTNIIVNFIILTTTLFLLAKNGVNVFNKEKMSFAWAKEFARVGGISGLESFVRNLAYMVMIARMVNVVNEQGTYWVANNFIWGWMLLPITQLGELIKQETSTNKDAVKNNTLGYFVITTITILAWCILIPAYKPFMEYVLNFGEVDKLFELVMVLFGFYVLYALQNVFDATFYGLGKTHYMLFESIVTNSIYYGIAFILYVTGVWTPSLIGIALLFGIGNAFDTIVSLGAYWFLLRRNHINILDVEKNEVLNNTEEV
jgi:Na+-driven multidrug efflux pump